MARPRLSYESILRVRHLELQELSIFQLGLLVKLASIAAVSPKSGYVCDETGRHLALEEIAERLKISHLQASKTMELLQNSGFLIFTDNGVLIIDWYRWVDPKLAKQREYMRHIRGK